MSLLFPKDNELKEPGSASIGTSLAKVSTSGPVEEDPDLAFALMDIKDMQRQWNPDPYMIGRYGIAPQKSTGSSLQSLPSKQRLVVSDGVSEDEEDVDAEQDASQPPSERLVSSDRDLSESLHSGSDEDQEEVATEEFIARKEQQIMEAQVKREQIRSERHSSDPEQRHEIFKLMPTKIEKDYVAEFLQEFDADLTTTHSIQVSSPETPVCKRRTMVSFESDESDIEIMSPENLLKMPLSLLRARTESLRQAKKADTNATVQLELAEKMRQQAQNLRLELNSQGLQGLTNKQKYQRDKLVSDTYLDRQRRKAEEIRRQEREEDGDYEDELPDDEEDGEGEEEDEEADLSIDSELEEEEEEEEDDDEEEEEEQEKLDLKAQQEEERLQEVEPELSESESEEPMATTLVGNARIVSDDEDEPMFMSRFAREEETQGDRQIDEDTLTNADATEPYSQTQIISQLARADPELATAVDTQVGPSRAEVQTQVVSHTHLLKPSKPQLADMSPPASPTEFSEEQRQLRKQFLAEQELAYQPTLASQLPSIIESDEDDNGSQTKTKKRSRIRLLKDFEEEKQAAKRMRILKQKEQKRVNRELRKKLDVLNEEASESEDEFAGAGGAEGEDDDDDDSDQDLEDLVDANFHDKGDSTRAQKLYAQRQLEQDQDDLDEVERIVNGGWRRGEQAGLDLAMNLNHEELMIRKREAIEKSRQKRIMEEERLTTLADNPKALAFMDTIADVDVLESSYLVGGLGESPEKLGEKNANGDEDSVHGYSEDKGEEEEDEEDLKIRKPKRGNTSRSRDGLKLLRSSLAFLNDVDSDEEHNSEEIESEDDERVVDPEQEISFDRSPLAKRTSTLVDGDSIESTGTVMNSALFDSDDDFLDMYQSRPLLAKKVGQEQREAEGVVITHSLKSASLRNNSGRSWAELTGDAKRRSSKKAPRMKKGFSTLQALAQRVTWDKTT